MRRLRSVQSPGHRVLVALAVAAGMVALAIISAHVAHAAGSGSTSTTPIGSDPSAPPWSVLDPKSDETRPVLTLFIIVGVESLIVFLLVCAALFINITRFSHKPGQDAEPKQLYGNRRLEILWTIIPAVILLIGFIATVVVMVEIAEPADAASALTIDVTGHQWWWEFHIPSAHVTTANALQIPDNRLVRFDITSADVVHDFWSPELFVQVNATPNITTTLYTDHPSLGIYPGGCYQFCGPGHAWMQFRIEVDTPSQFAAWVKHEAKPIEDTHLSNLALEGEGVFLDHSCGACHTINGLPSAHGTFAPNLTHVGSRWGIAGGVLAMSIPNLERWVTNPDQWKEGAKMPAFGFLTPSQLHDLATFLYEAK